jgi:hypothetical protein
MPAEPFFEAGESVVQGPIIDGAGSLYLWTASGKLIHVSSTGRARTHELNARDPAGAAIGTGGGLYFATQDGRVFGP